MGLGGDSVVVPSQVVGGLRSHASLRIVSRIDSVRERSGGLKVLVSVGTRKNWNAKPKLTDWIARLLT